MPHLPKTPTRPPPSNASARKRAPVTLHHKATCGDALAAYIRAAHAEITAARRNILATDDPAGPHQLADTATTRKLDTYAKAIADAVAPLREADVLLHETCNIPDVEHDAARAALQHALLRHRTAQALAARAALNGKQWASLKLYLSLGSPATADHPELERRLTAYATKAIERRWRKTVSAAKGLAHQSTDERHAVRLHLKRLRYTIDVFKPLYDKRPATAEQLKSFQSRLKDLQGGFGYLNDVAQASQLVPILTQEGSDNPAAHRLVGYIQGWHASRAEHAWTTTHKQWKRLRKAPRFWV
jgi:triphosphatase